MLRVNYFEIKSDGAMLSIAFNGKNGDAIIRKAIEQFLISQIKGEVQIIIK